MNNNSKLTPPLLGDAENQITLVGQAFEIKGDLIGLGAVVISGKIEGSVSANQVVVEKGASIWGNIACAKLDVSGQVRGQIEASDVIIRENAAIEGDVVYSTLAIESGGTISGNLKKIASKQSINPGVAQREFAQQKQQIQPVTRIAFPVDLSQKLRNHESRSSAYISLADGSPPPAWINLSQDKLGLIVGNPQFEQFKEDGAKITVRLHAGSQYFDLTLPFED